MTATAALLVLAVENALVPRERTEGEENLDSMVEAKWTRDLIDGLSPGDRRSML